jgi:hypothetical protein
MILLKLMIRCLQEIAALRQGILTCEGELRAVSSPAYTAKDRDRALAEQSVSTRVRGPPQSNQSTLSDHEKLRGGEQRRGCTVVWGERGGGKVVNGTILI